LDNLTHTLTAVAISHTGLNRKTRLATLTVILAANAPDIDLVARLGGSVTYLKYHRGITHSILGVIVLALVLAWIMNALGRRAQPKPGLPVNSRWLLLAAALGTCSHLLMDFTNSYGVRPFSPFSGRWYAWDIMFILDPLLLGLLGAGLGFPAILRLASEEVGARSTGLRRGAIFSLCAMVALWGLRDFTHRRVLSLMSDHTYSEENPQRVGVFPSPANPFEWTGIAETASAFHLLRTSALDTDVDPEAARTYHKPDSSPALEAALKTRTGRIFLDFARFPWEQAIETENGFHVSIHDLRFFDRLDGRVGFVADVELDKNLRVLSESFSFSAPSLATSK
jgi:inner membrane protein